MKFFGALKEQDFGMDRVHNGHTYRQFAGIMINDNLWLSIQASFAHYSRPRETLTDLNKYSHWEVAVFDREEFLRVSDVLPHFPSSVEMELYYDGSVYPYVPADLVEEVFLAFTEGQKKEELH